MMMSDVPEKNAQSIEEFFKSAPDDDKLRYMKFAWNLDKEKLFHELMRVHAESSRLLMQAEMEITHLRGVIDGPPTTLN
jgi:hypothetical protein